MYRTLAGAAGRIETIPVVILLAVFALILSLTINYYNKNTKKIAAKIGACCILGVVAMIFACIFIVVALILYGILFT